MQYPMPDNMGFPAPRSLMDMLPDEIPVEQMEAIRRHVGREKCGLHEYKCPICGAKFEAAKEYRYRIQQRGKEKVYCSHRCFRKDEEKEAERFRAAMLGRATKTQLQLEVIKAQRRLRHVKERLAAWQAKKDAPDFDQLTATQKAEIRRKLVKWQAEEVLAMEELEAVKRGE